MIWTALQESLGAEPIGIREVFLVSVNGPDIALSPSILRNQPSLVKISALSSNVIWSAPCRLRPESEHEVVLQLSQQISTWRLLSQRPSRTQDSVHLRSWGFAVIQLLDRAPPKLLAKLLGTHRLGKDSRYRVLIWIDARIVRYRFLLIQNRF